ncbi:antitoxin MazE-like protein [Bradyrhizobium sp. AZCC 1610]|uniref:antitoxin MazE-like protein n=1 Tax=Bradyrhizobium sp. AZCC 1610 TaxID=3117020 RepID=UPI002FEFB6C8
MKVQEHRERLRAQGLRPIQICGQIPGPYQLFKENCERPEPSDPNGGPNGI